MSTPRVFIDGHAGTTGLRIRDWLADREDLELWTLPEAERKSDDARRNAIAEADLTVLCLPDDAARMAAGWAAESGARLIDASSCHRVAEGWVYGLPELVKDQRDAIRDAQLVSNPGCYASAFLALVRPLVDAGILATDAPLTIHGLSGYSGGGKSLIAKWESPEEGRVGLPYEAPYSLERIHKHIPEMKTHSRLLFAPQFVPAVGAFACGMRDSFAYVTDTEYCPNAVKLAMNTNILYHEATFSDSLADKASETGHSSAKDAARVATEAQTKLLVIGHFSARYTNAHVLLKEARDGFYPAWLANELRPIFTDPSHERGIVTPKVELRELNKGGRDSSRGKGGYKSDRRGGGGKNFRHRKSYSSNRGRRSNSRSSSRGSSGGGGGDRYSNRSRSHGSNRYESRNSSYEKRSSEPDNRSASRSSYDDFDRF